MIDKFYKKSILIIILVEILLFLTHFVLLNTVLPVKVIQGLWWLPHACIPPITLFGLYYIVRKYKKSPNSVAKSFVFFVVVKMIWVMIFLAPWLLDKDDYSKPMVAQFFLIFFPFLLVETILLIKLLNKRFDEK